MKIRTVEPIHKSSKINLFEEYYFDGNLPTFQIFLDLDGVLTDFDGRFNLFTHSTPKKFEYKYGTDKFVEEVLRHGTEFWSGMSWTASGRELWTWLKKYQPTILTKPLDDEISTLGKAQWMMTNLGRKVPYLFSKNKEEFAMPNRVLIDDNFENVEKWKLKGGVGILHISNEQTINELKKLIGLKG